MEEKEKEKLLKDWLKFKKAENKAKKNRVETEVKIEELYGTKFKGKSKTFKEEELGFNVNVKLNAGYKMDQDAWRSVRSSIEPKLRPEKITFSLDEDGFVYLKKHHPEIYKKVSDCVEFKKGKTGIKVEKI
jgi:hypothetical protein